jgi:hypothetical protein
MTTCAVRWRPSGGRGEFEFVPADALMDREIVIDFGPLNLRIPAEVRGAQAQGKPRLRKFEKNNRKKFHLPQLVMGVAGLPEPSRSDLNHGVGFPLENKTFVMDAMDFDIIEDDGFTVVLEPLRVSVLHTNFQVQLGDRLASLAEDIVSVEEIMADFPELSSAIVAHRDAIGAEINDTKIRQTADNLIKAKSQAFGLTNAGSALKLINANQQTPVEAEEISGREGKLLTRIHVYRERDRGFSKRAKDHYRKANGGKLSCACCEMVPVDFYGPEGERAIEAHHTIPIEELQPDSVTLVSEMSMVCASCHRIIHSKKPCLSIDEVRQKLGFAKD